MYEYNSKYMVFRYGLQTIVKCGPNDLLYVTNQIISLSNQTYDNQIKSNSKVTSPNCKIMQLQTKLQIYLVSCNFSNTKDRHHFGNMMTII